jgi:ABC-type antimicrobial peptide transport system permease subunit
VSGLRARESALLETVREEIEAVDPQLPILELTSLRGFRDSALALYVVRAGAKLFTAFGAVALLLAVIGVYGVKSYVVSRRTREIGIRIALGASAGDVRRLLVLEGLALTGAGLAVGLLLAAAAASSLASLLYRVSAYDPVTFGSAALVLAAAALLATYLPARRATRVPPTTALRYE